MTLRYYAQQEYITGYGIHIVRNHTATGLDSVFFQVKNELKARKYTEHLDDRRSGYDIMIYDSVLISIDPL